MNRNRLLTSTALVSVMLALGAPGAQALSLHLGGFAEFWIGYGDNKKVAGTVTDVRNNFDVKHDAEIHFGAEEKLDNGITVGVLFEIEAGPGNALSSGTQSGGAADTEWDEAFAWVKTGWGQVNIGNNDPAAAYVGHIDVVGPIGIIKHDAENWVPGFHAAQNLDNDLGFKDSQNITYFTPRIGGFQLIVSYAPDQSDWREGDFDRSETSREHNAVSVAAKFERKFGTVGVGLGAGYSTAEARDNPAPFVTGSLEGYNVAVKLDAGPVRLTAGYLYESLHTRDERFWGVGLIYRINPVHAVSLGYGDGKRPNTSGPPPFSLKNDDHVIAAGWEADLGRGVSLAASVFQWEADLAGTEFDSDGWGTVGGLVLKF